MDATVRLVERGYMALGGLGREGREEAGEVVAKDWRVKAQSAVRGVMGRGRANWEDSPAWERLRRLAERLKE